MQPDNNNEEDYYDINVVCEAVAELLIRGPKGRISQPFCGFLRMIIDHCCCFTHTTRLKRERERESQRK